MRDNERETYMYIRYISLTRELTSKVPCARVGGCYSLSIGADAFIIIIIVELMMMTARGNKRRKDGETSG